MKTFLSNYFAPVMLGSAIGMLLLWAIPGSNYNIVHKAKTECEKNLPRDQKCVIIAVPEVKK